MSATEERLAYIRAEIERDLDDSKECIEKELKENPIYPVSGQPAAADEFSSEASCDTSIALEIENMMNSRNRNNHIYQINYDKPAEASASVTGALKNRLKQKIRRLIAPVIAPLVLEQNTFNASVTNSINVLSDNECQIAEFIKMQQEENQKLRKEMSELKQEVARLREENAMARLEIIRARKRLHREMKLVVEEMEEKQEK